MSVFRKFGEFLGLVDDEAGDYDLDGGYDDDEYSYDASIEDPRPARTVKTRVDRPGGITVTRNPVRPEAVSSESGGGSTVSRPVTRSPIVAIPAVRAVAQVAPSVHTCDPRSFDDAQDIGDRVKAGQPVIMNLRADDRELQRRLIDFASGLCYALSGTMSKVADHVFLLMPANVEVSADEVQRLTNAGHDRRF